MTYEKNRIIHETKTETLFYCSGIYALVNKETKSLKALNLSDAAFWMLHNSTLVEFEREFYKLSDAAKELFSNSLKIKDLRCTKKFCWKINLCFEK